jgi:hypothetical protein
VHSEVVWICRSQVVATSGWPGRGGERRGETIHDLLNGKSTDLNHNMIVPGDHAITLTKPSLYHSSYITNTYLRRVTTQMFTHYYIAILVESHTIE